MGDFDLGGRGCGLGGGCHCGFAGVIDLGEDCSSENWESCDCF